MAALVVAAIAQPGDRPAWLAAILGDRFGAGAVAIGAPVAMALACGSGAFAGIAAAPWLTPAAARLLLAAALAVQGIGALVAPRAPDRLTGWRLGGVATATTGLAVLLFGEGVPFIVFALAAGSATPWLAATGAVAGASPVLVAAAAIGERRWSALPLRGVRIAVGIVLATIAAWLALGAFGLV